MKGLITKVKDNNAAMVLSKNASVKDEVLAERIKNCANDLKLVENYKKNMETKEKTRKVVKNTGIGLSVASVGFATIVCALGYAVTSGTLHYTHETPDLDKLIKKYTDLEQKGYVK